MFQTAEPRGVCEIRSTYSCPYVCQKGHHSPSVCTAIGEYSRYAFGSRPRLSRDVIYKSSSFPLHLALADGPSITFTVKTIGNPSLNVMRHENWMSLPVQLSSGSMWWLLIWITDWFFWVFKCGFSFFSVGYPCYLITWFPSLPDLSAFVTMCECSIVFVKRMVFIRLFEAVIDVLVVINHLIGLLCRLVSNYFNQR